MAAARKTVLEKVKLEGLLRAYASMSDKVDFEVDELTSLDPERFLKDYYATNRAFVLRGGAKHWNAVERWTFDLFRERFGSESVDYMYGEQRYADLAGSTRTTDLASLLDLMRQAPLSNAYYIASVNQGLTRMVLETLSDWGEFEFLPGIDMTNVAKVRLWLGPKGTITPLHCDAINVLFVQITGSKKFVLAPSHEVVHIYNERSLFSSVDPACVDAAAFPDAVDIRWRAVEVEAGDILFIPLGWWHWVYANSESISVSIGEFEIMGSLDRWSA